MWTQFFSISWYAIISTKSNEHNYNKIIEDLALTLEKLIAIITFTDKTDYFFLFQKGNHELKYNNYEAVSI